MSVTPEQLAEILSGIVRAQQAVIDAIESQHGGFKNNHLLPKLTVAANARQVNARLLDIPSRALLRSQSRVPMEPAQLAQDIRAAIGAGASPAAGAAAPAPAAAPAAAPGDDLDFMKS